MDLFFTLILIGAVTAIIMYPLVRGRGAVPAGAPSPPEAARTRFALTAIKELEFDYETGKIDDDDYRTLRARYDARAVEALEQPGPRHSSTAPAHVDAAAHEDLTAQIEAEVRLARARRFCTHCGGILPQAARFCPACGTPVEGTR